MCSDGFCERYFFRPDFSKKAEVQEIFRYRFDIPHFCKKKLPPVDDLSNSEFPVENYYFSRRLISEKIIYFLWFFLECEGYIFESCRYSKLEKAFFCTNWRNCIQLSNVLWCFLPEFFAVSFRRGKSGNGADLTFPIAHAFFKFDAQFVRTHLFDPFA